MPLPGTSALFRGLLPEDPFLETYVVRPGGATMLELGPDERVTVVDPDGGQVAELAARIGADLQSGAGRHRRGGGTGRAHRGRRATAVEPPRLGSPHDPRRYEQGELPPPLAEPRLDVRVDAATALAYEV